MGLASQEAIKGNKGDAQGLCKEALLQCHDPKYAICCRCVVLASSKPNILKKERKHEGCNTEDGDHAEESCTTGDGSIENNTI